MGNETQVCYCVNMFLGDAPSLELILELYPALVWGLIGGFSCVNQACVGGAGAGGDLVLLAGVLSTAGVWCSMVLVWLSQDILLARASEHCGRARA